jgi:hypothetical protein
MHMLVHDAENGYNHLLFCLYDEHLKAIRKRDAWINSSWPLAKQVTRPLSGDPLEVERAQVQEIYRESVNRIQGGLEALFSSDPQAAAQHFLDALLVLTHQMADMEARRWAANTNSDALLQRRAAIQQGAGGSAVRDVMYALSKKESSMQNFFHHTGSGGQHQQTSLQPQIYSTSVGANPTPFNNQQPYTTQQPLTTPTPAQFQSVGGAVQVYQYPGQQTWNRGGRKKRGGRGGQDNSGFLQGFRGAWRGQRGFSNKARRGGGRGAWNANTENAQGQGVLPGPAPAILPLPPGE